MRHRTSLLLAVAACVLGMVGLLAAGAALGGSGRARPAPPTARTALTDAVVAIPTLRPIWPGGSSGTPAARVARARLTPPATPARGAGLGGASLGTGGAGASLSPLSTPAEVAGVPDVVSTAPAALPAPATSTRPATATPASSAPPAPLSPLASPIPASPTAASSPEPPATATATWQSTVTPAQPSATPWPTVTSRPSATPLPSATPTASASPTPGARGTGRIAGQVLLDGLGVGVPLTLTLENQAYGVVAQTSAAIDGSFVFGAVPVAASGYNVVFSLDNNPDFFNEQAVTWAWLGPVVVQEAVTTTLPALDIATHGFGPLAPRNRTFAAAELAASPILFNWAPYPGASSYWLDLYQGSALQNAWQSPPQAGTSATWDGLLATGGRARPDEYYWGVGARCRITGSYTLTVYGDMPRFLLQ